MSDETTIIRIFTLSDSLEARMRARQLARTMGFNLQEQAFISLATWELAIQLGMGISREGSVNIDTITKDNRQGICIVYSFEKMTDSDQNVLSSNDIKSIVDEIEIRKPKQQNGLVEISAIKWARQEG